MTVQFARAQSKRADNGGTHGTHYWHSPPPPSSSFSQRLLQSLFLLTHSQDSVRSLVLPEKFPSSFFVPSQPVRMLNNRKIITFIQLEQSTNSPNTYIKTLESILGGISTQNYGDTSFILTCCKVEGQCLPSQHSSHHETHLSSL